MINVSFWGSSKQLSYMDWAISPGGSCIKRCRLVMIGLYLMMSQKKMTEQDKEHLYSLKETVFSLITDKNWIDDQKFWWCRDFKAEALRRGKIINDLMQAVQLQSDIIRIYEKK